MMASAMAMACLRTTGSALDLTVTFMTDRMPVMLTPTMIMNINNSISVKPD
jgi:hypothetical protein